MRIKYFITVLMVINIIIMVSSVNRINLLTYRSIGGVDGKNKVKYSCIFVFNQNNEIEISLVTDYLNNRSIIQCKLLYVLIPAIGDVKGDLMKNNLSIIRFVYPNPLKYALLMPMYLEVDECVIFNIKQCNIDKLNEDINNFFRKLKYEKVNSRDVVDSYLIRTEHIRYVYLYRGPLYFRQNMDLILKDTYSFSYYYSQYPLDNNISYNTCIENKIKNDEIGIILRLRRRDNMNISINSFLKYNNFTTLVLAQNEQFIDFRWVFYNSTFIRRINNIYLFLCSNWNSVFYLFRLIPLLLNTEYTIVMDDDFIVKPELIEFGKYSAEKKKRIISPIGWKPYRRTIILIDNMTYHLRYTDTLYSGQILKSEWFVYVYRMKIPYKLWGDEVSTALSIRIMCGYKLAFVNRYISFLPQDYYYGELNRTNYILGPKLIYPFMKKCENFTSKPSIIDSCFFKIPN